jgi:rhomboid family GlyGly-CTERM serine protease
MNAESPAAGLGSILRSLNFDRAYGIALLCACLALIVPALFGEPARQILSFYRVGIADGQLWRLATAHFVHLDLEHAILNSLGAVLMWALFARDYSPWRWAAIYLGSMFAVSAGLWFATEKDWYVGASGALHGVMTAGTIAHLRRRDLDGWILAAFIIAKLSYEQTFGALPFAGSPDTVVDAHLYGAIGGVVMALPLNSRRQPG